MGARWIVGLLALAVLLGASPARAADPPHLAIRLAYDHGPEGCAPMSKRSATTQAATRRCPATSSRRR